MRILLQYITVGALIMISVLMLGATISTGSRLPDGANLDERMRAWDTKLDEACKPRTTPSNRFRPCFAVIRYTTENGVREAGFIHAIHANGEPIGFRAPNQTHVYFFLRVDPKTVTVAKPEDPAFQTFVEQYLSQTAID